MRCLFDGINIEQIDIYIALKLICLWLKLRVGIISSFVFQYIKYWLISKIVNNR